MRFLSMNFTDVGPMTSFFSNSNTVIRLTDREDLHILRFFMTTDICRKKMKLLTQYQGHDLMIESRFVYDVDEDEVTIDLFEKMIELIDRVDGNFYV